MLFNSFEFLFIFLPVVVSIFYLINHLGTFQHAKAWLLAVSFVYYGWFKLIYIPFLVISILVNYQIATILGKNGLNKKTVLTCGVIFNVAVLVYFKYMNFFIDNINAIGGANLSH